MIINASTDPEHISVSKSKGIRIEWRDGHVSEYGLDYLRDHCPCATCTGAHGTPPRQPSGGSPFQMYKPATRIVNADPVGSYALRIGWNDGHNTGIYSWELFRSLCPCPECRAQRGENGE
ncbi:MAG TPA: DUF971 domain-containing protein [Bryobacteraceae bacterium]|nr:DUF971 domain-containing protein [Bryobacteraceae bacterium]